ncbi:MAG: hypothetical protein J6328_04635 [Bacilli bacterium]|nr:hypothetical protein [Bacilli bacterium]
MLLVFSFGFFFLGRFLYKKEKGERYSLLSDFPFELFPRGKDGGAIYLRILYGLALASSLGLPYYFAASFFSLPEGIFLLGLLSAIFLLGKGISLLFLSFLPAYYHKAHIALDAISFSLSGISLFISGYFLFKLNGPFHRASFFLAIAAMVIALLIILMMCSPRFSSWVKIGKEGDEGEVKAKRPRFFLLAASEWGLYALTLFGDVLLYLSLGFLLLDI